MKKCPFCKADIEDNARFCLYCMKPLNEKEIILPPQRKKKWWLLILVGTLLVALLLVVILIPKGQAELPEDTRGTETVTSTQTIGLETTESIAETIQDTQGEDPALPENVDTNPTNPGKSQGEQSGGTTQKQEYDNEISEPTQSSKPAVTTTPTKPEVPTQNTTPSTEPEETTAATTEPEVPKTQVVYTYRAARAGDDFNAQYQNTGNDIVITGISQPSADGIYDIPSYIDGKKVIAIVANAFSGSNAKIVYVPATVKTIWNYAFAGCGLTDIYFRGNAIYTESKAFSGSVTIHCAASCSDRNFRYYKSCAASYGATWAEWNG